MIPYKKAKILFNEKFGFQAFEPCINIDTGEKIIHCKNLNIGGNADIIGENYNEIPTIQSNINIPVSDIQEIVAFKEEYGIWANSTEWFVNTKEAA